MKRVAVRCFAGVLLCMIGLGIAVVKVLVSVGVVERRLDFGTMMVMTGRRHCRRRWHDVGSRMAGGCMFSGDDDFAGQVRHVDDDAGDDGEADRMGAGSKICF